MTLLWLYLGIVIIGTCITVVACDELEVEEEVYVELPHMEKYAGDDEW